MRGWLGLVKSYGFVLWIGLGINALALMVVGGKRWWRKLLWSGAFLTAAALISYALTGPVWDAVISDRIHSAIDSAISVATGEESALVDVSITKALEISGNVSRAFSTGLAQLAIGFVVAGLVAMLLSIVWTRVRARQEAPAPSGSFGPSPF